MVALVERKISKKNLVIAGIITFLFFSMGILLGVLLTDKRVESLQSVATTQKMDYESMQLQTLFLEESTAQDRCTIVSKAMDSHVQTLSDTGGKIEGYIDNAKMSSESFNEAKREYILAELKYWLLSKKAKKLCDRDMVSVLYFYSDTGECDECSTQSRILTYLKGRFPEQLLVFSFDLSFENEAMISMLKSVYGVTEYPTLVIDEQKFSGLVTEEQLMQELCSRFKAPYPECEGY